MHILTNGAPIIRNINWSVWWRHPIRSTVFKFDAVEENICWRWLDQISSILPSSMPVISYTLSDDPWVMKEQQTINHVLMTMIWL